MITSGQPPFPHHPPFPAHAAPLPAPPRFPEAGTPLPRHTTLLPPLPHHLAASPPPRHFSSAAPLLLCASSPAAPFLRRTTRPRHPSPHRPSPRGSSPRHPSPRRPSPRVLPRAALPAPLLPRHSSRAAIICAAPPAPPSRAATTCAALPARLFPASPFVAPLPRRAISLPHHSLTAPPLRRASPAVPFPRCVASLPPCFLDMSRGRPRTFAAHAGRRSARLAAPRRAGSARSAAGSMRRALHHGRSSSTGSRTAAPTHPRDWRARSLFPHRHARRVVSHRTPDGSRSPSPWAHRRHLPRRPYPKYPALGDIRGRRPASSPVRSHASPVTGMRQSPGDRSRASDRSQAR